MNYLILGLAVAISVAIVFVYTRTQNEDLKCKECIKSGGKCVHDKAGKFVSCQMPKPRNVERHPYKSYGFSGIPQFPL